MRTAGTGGTVSRRFAYDIDRRFVLVCRAFGLRPGRHGVVLTDDERFVATYGLFTIDTPRSNIEGAHVTEAYRWWTAIGVRTSFADSGLTFGTNARSGVCVHFRVPTPSPLRRRGHAALTVTVEHPAELVGALGF